MHSPPIPLSSLPAWCKFNDIHFLDTTISSRNNHGNGIVSTKSLNSMDTFDIPVLLEVSGEVLLGREFLAEMERCDAGGGWIGVRRRLDGEIKLSTRKDVMLFLLMQITMAMQAEEHERGVRSEIKSLGLRNPWTQYVGMLPERVPVPTMWSEEERMLLVGTSLESAITAKMSALLREFEELREKTSDIPWCNSYWWENESLTLSDWIRLDAWYRSRSLELPTAGEVMVPCLDMANHSSNPNAYYERTTKGDVHLLLRPNMQLKQGEEITISYGASKSDAEMLFSYGFIDEDSTIAELVLNLDPLPGDPLGKAKFAAFPGRPIVRIIGDENGNISWESSFLFLMCLNEEDGLDFKVLQETNGSQNSLRVFWQDSDVTESANTFESLIANHELIDIFKLRAVSLLQDRIGQQLQRLYGSEEVVQTLLTTMMISEDAKDSALKLRRTETAILEAAYESVEAQKTELLRNENVLKYLGSTNSSNTMEETPPDAETNEEDDFS